MIRTHLLQVLRKHFRSINAFLTVCSSVPLALWINLLTNDSRPKWIWQDPFFDLLFPLLTILLLYIQFYAIRRLGPLSRETTEGICGVLRFGVEILASRSGVDDRQVRGHCYRYENGKLIPIAYFARGFQKDSSLPIPIMDEWFIISRAFRDSEICCENADWRNPSDLSRGIWVDVQGVIACPIKPLPDSAMPQLNITPPIGIISFDASLSCEEMGWTTRRQGKLHINASIEEAMTALAAVVFTSMKRDLGNGPD